MWHYVTVKNFVLNLQKVDVKQRVTCLCAAFASLAVYIVYVVLNLIYVVLSPSFALFLSGAAP